MMTTRPARREMRTLVFGVAAVALILVGGRVMPAWLTWQREVQLRADAQQRALARARASVRDTSMVRDTLTRRAARLAQLAGALLPGRTTAAGAGALVSLVTDAATDAGMRVAAIQLRTTDSVPAGGHARVGVRADLVGDIAGLSAFLRTMEGGRTLLAVHEIDINQPEPAAPPDRAEALRVQLLVEGLVAVSPPASTQPSARPQAPERDR